jgi:hypothetical protein
MAQFSGKVALVSQAPQLNEVEQRIGQLVRDFRRLSISELCQRADTIRRLAQMAGMEPACRLAASLAVALAHHGRAALVQPYLEGLTEAAGCDPADARAGDVILAAVNVRLAG